MKVFEKVGDIFREVGGFSEILKISLRFWVDFQRMSEDTFLLEVVRKEFQQVA